MKNNSGQALLMSILIIGMVMAAIILYGSRRQSDVAILVERLDTSQTAYEVLSAAAKKIQIIYSNESGCDPDVLNNRISRFTNLPTLATSLGYTNVTYAIAQPSRTTAAEKYNFCNNASTTGCRQLGIPLENRVFVVTVGAVVSEANPGSGDCPRDATVRLSVTIGGNLYMQRATLINLCTLASCGTGASSFSTATANVSLDTGAATTSACGFLPVRYYGSITSSPPVASNTTINVNDLRWARRYLETGGAGVGETTYMIPSASITDGSNGSCAPASSASQCNSRNCVPAFDLNRDKTNNDSDLAILEYYLRGFLATLPVTYLQ